MYIATVKMFPWRPKLKLNLIFPSLSPIEFI